jgi:putative Mg2+ transporter-C (MgtC) family protein
VTAALSDPGLSMVANIALALVLGWVVGYERYFSGRAAGTQVYCLVCATSCAVTLVAGYPGQWYGMAIRDAGVGDPTRVMGSILTGIGFLGAGIIVKSGLNVRGLTTAASIWGSSAIGILVGVHFYLPAIGLTALFVASVALIPRFEHKLPAHSAIGATLRFKPDFRPRAEEIDRFLSARGLRIPVDSLTITRDGDRFELQCLIFGNTSSVGADSMTRIASALAEIEEVVGFTVTHSSRA